jgi:hypothetical protein
VGLLPLEAWVVVGEAYVASGSASSRFSARESLRMAAGSRGLWGLDFLDPGDVVSLDYFLSERS